MAIHTRRPQDPPDMPKITIGSGPGLPPGTGGAGDEAAAIQAARAAEAAAAAATAAGSAARPAEAPAPGATSARDSGREKGDPATGSGGREMWLVALLGSLAPMLGSLFAPPSATPVLIGVAAGLIVTGVVLYFRGRGR